MNIKHTSKFFMVTAFIAAFTNTISAPCMQTIPGTNNTKDISNVITALNTKFNKIKADKDCAKGEPLYKCTGILVHTINNIGTSTTIHPNQKSCPVTAVPANVGWCPGTNEASSGRVSFSYLRKDIMPAEGQIIYNYDSEQGPSGHSPAPGVGYILNIHNLASSTQLNKLNTHTQARLKPFDLLCSYPADGATVTRANYGCDPALNKSYYSQAPKNYFNISGNNPVRFADQPSIDAADFNYFIKVAGLTNYDAIYKKLPITNNEFVIGSWEGVSYTAIPLQAYYYVTNDDKMDNSISQSVANTEAKLYYQATKKYVPVVAVDMGLLRETKAASPDVNPFICPA